MESLCKFSLLVQASCSLELAKTLVKPRIATCWDFVRGWDLTSSDFEHVYWLVTFGAAGIRPDIDSLFILFIPIPGVASVMLHLGYNLTLQIRPISITFVQIPLILSLWQLVAGLLFILTEWGCDFRALLTRFIGTVIDLFEPDLVCIGVGEGCDSVDFVIGFDTFFLHYLYN